MERVYRFWFERGGSGSMSLLLALFLILSWWVNAAWAGVVMAPSTRAADSANYTEENDENGYPESRFGEGPQPLRSFERPDFLMGRRVSESGKKSRQRRSIASVLEQEDGSEELGVSAYQKQEPVQLETWEMKRKGVQEFSIIAGELGYFPSTIFVTQNIPVRLYVTGTSKRPLCMIMDAFQVRRQIQSDQVTEITFTPRVPNTYEFFCPINGMTGTLVVREFGG